MRKTVKPATPVGEMTLERLRTELVLAQRQLHSHRPGVYGSCHQRCEDDYPCQVTRRASQRLHEVSEALAARTDRIEQARLEWQ